MTIILKGGAQTEDARLDRVYQLDLRSLNYLVPPVLATPSRPPRSYTWAVTEHLDQGAEGACVGFGFSHDLLARPVRVAGVTNQFARERVYWEAQKIDDWDGGAYPGASPQYEGTSVLAGAQVLTKLGFYKSYRWAITALDLAGSIFYEGPAILGLAWYEGMWDTDADGFIAPTGKEVGGHCILCRSVHFIFTGPTRTWEFVDLDKSFVVVWNSWGPNWGVNGYAKITLRNMQKLIESDHGEACFPVRNKTMLRAV